jgi:hypothetical protein
MATRSYIGTRNTDGSVDYIYCHFDGYPSGVGAVLAVHYTVPTKVEALMKLGDLSVLGEFIGEKQDFTKGSTPGSCLAYGRDRGESNVEFKTGNFNDLINNRNVDYTYIWDGGYWECFDTSNPDEIIDLYTEK